MYLEGLKKVIEKLESVLPKALELEKEKGFSVNMLQPNVFSDCGSPMCFAGWFYGFQKYKESAEYMAKVCGFSNKITMELWAIKNPILWGNNRGDCIFSCRKAFGIEEVNSANLSTIINHLKQVYTRVEKYQTNSTYRLYVDVLQKVKTWKFLSL